MIFLLHIKISDQIHLQKYGQKGQNVCNMHIRRSK